MDRKEFCEILTKARKESGVKMKDICSISGLNRDAVNRIERGVHNFDLEKVLKYLIAIKHTIKLQPSNSDKYITIQHYSNFLGLFKRFKNKYTERQLATLIGCHHSIIGRIIQKKNIANIDTFLKLIAIMEYDIKLEAQPSISATNQVESRFTALRSDDIAITKTRTVFERLIQRHGWHSQCSDINFTVSQCAENLYKRNELYLDDMVKILKSAGYTCDLCITLPYGKTFDNFEDAYKYTYLTHPPKPSLYQFLDMSENDIKRINKRFGQSYVCTDMIYMYLIKVGCNIDMLWNIADIEYDNENVVYNMLTNDAFKSLMETSHWHELSGISHLQSVNAKKLFRANQLGLDSMYGYLYASGYVGHIEITSPQNKVFNNYFDALCDMLLLPDIISILGDKQLYMRLCNKSTELWSTLRISTVHKYLETAGYQVIVKWGVRKNRNTQNFNPTDFL